MEERYSTGKRPNCLQRHQRVRLRSTCAEKVGWSRHQSKLHRCSEKRSIISVSHARGRWKNKKNDAPRVQLDQRVSGKRDLSFAPGVESGGCDLEEWITPVYSDGSYQRRASTS